MMSSCLSHTALSSPEKLLVHPGIQRYERHSRHTADSMVVSRSLQPALSRHSNGSLATQHLSLTFGDAIVSASKPREKIARGRHCLQKAHCGAETAGLSIMMKE
jgi:hypothetical protein